MSTKTPAVSAGWLYDPNARERSMRLDTPAWFAWLEAATTSRFSYPLYDPRQGYIVGMMTVRKERRQRGGMYWSVFRRAGGRVRKIYLGRASAVTQVRLDAIAAGLREASTEQERGSTTGG